MKRRRKGGGGKEEDERTRGARGSLAGGWCDGGAHARTRPHTSPVSQCGHLVPPAMVADLWNRFDLCETINPANDGLMVRESLVFRSHSVSGRIIGPFGVVIECEGEVLL